MQAYVVQQERLQEEILNKSLNRNNYNNINQMTTMQQSQSQPYLMQQSNMQQQQQQQMSLNNNNNNNTNIVGTGNKSVQLIRAKRQRRRQEFRETLKKTASQGIRLPRRKAMDRSLTESSGTDVSGESISTQKYNVEDSSHYRVNRALRSQIAANRKQHTDMLRFLGHLKAERDRLNNDKVDLSRRLNKLQRQQALNEKRSEMRGTRPESHLGKDKVEEALEKELALLEKGSASLEEMLEHVVDVLESMDRAVTAAEELIEDKVVAMNLDKTVLATLDARTDHLSVGCGRSSAGFKRTNSKLKHPELLTKKMPELLPLMHLKPEDVHAKKSPEKLVEEIEGEAEAEEEEAAGEKEEGEGEQDQNANSNDVTSRKIAAKQRLRSASPESQIPTSPKHDQSLISVKNWEHKFTRLSKRCKDLVKQACQTRVDIKATCQSLGDYCSNADLQQAQKQVSFDFREHLRKEKLIIENVEAELKDMKVIRRAEKAEGRVKRVLKEKLASIAVFEERVTVRLANRPPGELTNDTAANEIRHAIADLREDARDLDNELKRIQQDLAFLRKEKEETEEHIKDKRVAVKVDTKAFQIGEKKRSTPKKYQVTKEEEAEDTTNKEKGKKKKNGKGRNIWAYYY